MAGAIVAAFAFVGCATNGTELNGVAPQTAAPKTVVVTAPVVATDPSITAESTQAPTSPAPTEPATTEAPGTQATPTQPSSTEAATTQPRPTEPPTTVATTTEPPVTEEVDPLQPFINAGFERAPALKGRIEPIGKASGAGARAVQQRLLDLGFWVSGVDGDYGQTTTQGVMAFQKYHGLTADGKVGPETAKIMNETGLRVRGDAREGNLIEVDKTKQLLFIVRDGRTLWALNTSTGDGKEYEEEDKNTPGEIVRGVSLTPNGFHKVNRERPEGWWEGDLGKIYRPKYFRGGVAVHGSGSIPNYPASHGCVRVSVPAMDWIWSKNFMPKGATVWVHGG